MMMEIKVTIVGTEGLETVIKQLACAVAQVAEAKQGPATKTNVLPTQQTAPTLAQTAAVQQPVYQQQQFTQQQAPTNQQTPAQQIQQMQQPIYPQASYQQPIQQQAPVQQTMQSQPLPTTHAAQSYSQDQLAVAMTAMCDAGKVNDVMGILKQFGAETLMQVPVEQYATLATMMRGIGANI